MSPFVLGPLPYGKNSLEPYMSSRTLDFHHGKHHATYIKKLNTLIKDTPYSSQSIEEIIINSYKKDNAIFNNAAQVYNHDFFWKCMKPSGGGKPGAKLLSKLSDVFTDFDNFVEKYTQAALSLFGSGWVWLVLDKANKLKIEQHSNASTPITEGKKALLTLDVWEHSYYLDYMNDRASYIKAFFTHLVNWGFVEGRLIDKGDG